MYSATILWAAAVTSLLTFVLADEISQRCKSITSRNSSDVGCDAMHLLSRQEQDYCLRSNFKTAHWASSSAPLASFLPIRSTKQVAYFLGKFDGFARFLGTRYPVGDIERICYTTKSVRHTNGKRRIISTCFRERTMSSSESEVLREHMQEFKTSIEEMATKLLRRAQHGTNPSRFFDALMRCWESLYTTMVRVEKDKLFSCSVYNLLGIRFGNNNSFSLVVMLTNTPCHYMMEENKRQFVLETWQLDTQGRVQAIPLPSYGLNDSQHRINHTSTRLQIGGGQAARSAIANPRSIDRAVNHVMRLSNIHAESVADSVTPSNIAILILPALITSFIPTSLFQLVDCTWKLVLYALVSDLIAALPLLFKGLELLFAAKMQHSGCVERIDDSGLLESVTQIEISCASCTHHAWFAQYGIALVTTAAVLLVLGIVIELVSYKWMLHNEQVLKRMKEWRKLQWYRRCWWEEAPDNCTDNGGRHCGHIM